MLVAATLKAGVRDPPNGSNSGMLQFAHSGVVLLGEEKGSRRRRDRRAPMLDSVLADAAQPVGSPPGAELAHLSVVSAVSLLPRIRVPRDPVGPTKGRGPPKQASCPPTAVRGSLPGEFLKQFIPFAGEESGERALTEPALSANSGIHQELPQRTLNSP